MAKPISLVISDVDGTLVAPDKTLTDASVRAVRLLHERGRAGHRHGKRQQR